MLCVRPSVTRDWFLRFSSCGRLLVTAALATALVLCCSKSAHASGFSITVEQLTTNSTVDQMPQVWGSNIAWQGVGGSDSGTDNEIFFYDGSTISQLTVNTVHDLNPRISSAGVLWERGAGTAAEIIFHDGVSETPLTSNAVADTATFMSGNLATWVQGGGTAQDVMLWDGNAVTNLTASLGAGVVDRLPHTDGSSVVWMRGSTPNSSIMLYDGSTISTVATSTRALEDPKVDGEYIVWEGFKGATTNDREIYLYDGDSVVQLTDDAFPNFDPQISGHRVVWWGGVFNNFHIFMYDILTDTYSTLFSAPVAQFPQIDGDFVVWQARLDGETDTEIFLWDGQQVHRVTDNAFNDSNARISGNHIVWQGQAPTSIEIFHATFVVPEPHGLVLAAIGAGLALVGAVRYRRRAPAHRED